MLFGNGHIVDFLFRIDNKPVFIRDFLYACIDFFDFEFFPVIDAEDNILRGRKHVNQFEMLMHHPYFITEGIVGGTDHRFFPVYDDSPFVGIVNPRDHIHEGRFPAPVFAEDRKDLPLKNRQADILIGYDGSEIFGNAFQF